MKKFLNIFFLAAVIAGCSNNAPTAGKESQTTVKEEAANDEEANSLQSGINDVNVDTIGMAEFLALKAEEAAKYRQSNGIQSASDIHDMNVDTIGFAEYKRWKAETARQAFEDSIRRAEIIAGRRESIANAEKNAGSRDSRTGTSQRASEQNKRKNETASSDQTNVDKEPSETVKEKKGWSNKAKGAVIGAATGAAAGAIINKKNRKVGGVVGGVVGAATGYGIGRHKDKKDTEGKQDLIQDTTDQQQ